LYIEKLTNMTFRDLLNKVDEDKILNYLLEKEIATDMHFVQVEDKENIKNDYKRVISNMKSLPSTVPYKWNIVVLNEPYPDTYSEEEEPFIIAALENPEYEVPPKHLKPWGCRNNDYHPPEGYYNSNDDKYVKYFSFSFEEWKNIIDTEVLNRDNFDDVTLVSEIIWEATFYGFTQEKIKENLNELKKRSDEYDSAKKEGRIEIVRDEKFNFDVVKIIPKNDKHT